MKQDIYTIFYAVKQDIYETLCSEAIYIYTRYYAVKQDIYKTHAVKHAPDTIYGYVCVCACVFSLTYICI